MTEQSAPMPGRERVALIATCVLVQVLALAAAPILFSNDGPQHLLSAYMFAHPEQAAGDWEVIHPITDNGYRQVFWLFDAVLGWRTAHHVVSSLPLVVALFGWLILATEERKGAAARAALLLGVSLPWHAWIGLLPFLYSTAFVPFVYLLIRRPTTKRWLLAALLMLIQTTCHPFPVMVSGLLFFVTRTSIRDLIATGLSGVPAAVIAALVAAQTVSASAGGVEWALEPDFFRQLFSQYVPGPQMFRVVLTVIFGFVLCAAMFFRAQLSAERARLLVVSAAAVCVTAILPDAANGWELVRSRFLPTALPMFVALTPLYFSVARLNVLAIAFGVFSMSYVGWFVVTARDLDRAYGDIYDGLEAQMPTLRGKFWQLEIFDTAVAPDPVPEIDSYGGTAHMAQVLAVSKGGQPNFTQAFDRALHGVIYTRRLKDGLGRGEHYLGAYAELWAQFRDDPDRRRIDISSYMAHNYTADVMIVAGNAGDGEALEFSGYDVVPLGKTAAGLSLFQATFRGCTVEATFEAAVADVIEIGVLPRGGAVEAFAIPAGDTTLQLPRLPCGNWWVRGEVSLAPGGHAVVHVSQQNDAFTVRQLP